MLTQKEQMVSSSRNAMRYEKAVALINRAKHILVAAPDRTSGTKTVIVCTLCSHASRKYEDARCDSHVTHCRWAVPSQQRLWKFICLEFKPPGTMSRWPIRTDYWDLKLCLLCNWHLNCLKFLVKVSEDESGADVASHPYKVQYWLIEAGHFNRFFADPKR